MAADGSILIEANIDPSEADKGLAEITGAINEAEKALEKDPKNNGIIKAIDKAKEAAGNLDKIIHDALSNARSEIEMSDAEFRKAIEATRELEPGTGEKIDSGKILRDIEESAYDAERGVNEMKQAFENAKSAIKELEGQGKFFGDAEYDEAVTKLDNIKQKINEYKSDLLSPAEPQNPFGLDTIAYKVREAEIRLQELIDMGKALGDEDYDKAYRSLALLKKEAKEYANTLTKTQAELDKDAEAKARAAQRTAELAEKERQAAEEAERLNAIRENATVADDNVASWTRQLEDFKAQLKEMSAAGLGLGFKEFDDATMKVAELSGKLADYKKTLTDTSTASSQAGERIKNILGKAFSTVGKTAKSAASAVGKFAKNQAHQLFTKTANAAKRASKNIIDLAKSFLHLDRSSRKSSASLSDGLKTILKYAFGIRSLFVLFNKMRSAMVEGFKNLAQYSDTTNQSISMVMSALTQLKNALATAFAPILDVVAPIITRFIEMLSSAADSIARLTSQLTGKTSYVRAKKVQQDYAASLKKTEKASKDAKEATDEAAGSLASFDEINTIATENNKKAAEANKDAAEEGLTPADMFEEVQIEPLDFDSWGEAFSAFLDYCLENIPKLEAALDTAANAINGFAAKLYEMFTFPGVQEKANKLGSEIARALNDAINKIDWHLLGQALGAGLNTALNFMEGFIYDFDWMNLGNKIADLINGAFEEIDFEKLGKLLWAKLKIALETLAGLITGLNMPLLAKSASDLMKGFFDAMYDTVIHIPWRKIGEQIATFLNSFDWDGVFISAGRAIAAAVNGIVDTINTITDKTEWGRIGRELAAGFNRLVKDINWYEFGRALFAGFEIGIKTLSGFITGLNMPELARAMSAFVRGILDRLSSAIQSADWAEIGRQIVRFIVNIDWAGLFASAANLAGSLAGAILSFLGGAIAEALGKITTFFRKEIEACGGNIVLGILKGIKDALVNIGRWIVDNIFTPFINGFKKAFKISSPSKVMAEMGKYLIDGLIEGIKNAWKGITEFFMNILDPLKKQLRDAWDSIKKDATAAWTEIKNTASDIWSSIKEDAKALWGEIKEAVEPIWNNFKTECGTVFNTVRDTVSNAWRNIQTQTSSTWGSVKTTVLSAWNNIKTQSSSTWGTVLNNVKTAWTYFSNNVSGIFGKVEDCVTKAWNNVESCTRKVWNGLSDFIRKPVSSILSFIDTMVNGVVTGFNGMIRALNRLKIDIPEWVPNIGGGKLGFNIPEIPKVYVPRLAAGTVVPPNKEFMAVLGDNKRETEIVSPLSTMKQALSEALQESGGAGNGTITVVVNLDGREVARNTVRHINTMTRQAGRSILEV